MKQTAVEWLENELNELSSMGLSIGKYSSVRKNIFEQAKQMQDEQMQLTWNNAIEAVQKDKWHSYYEFYNNNFKSE